MAEQYTSGPCLVRPRNTPAMQRRRADILTFGECADIDTLGVSND